MNALDTANALPVRDTGGARVEVQCPKCSAWRPGFCVVKLDAAMAAALDSAWACDADLSRWRRTQP